MPLIDLLQSRCAEALDEDVDGNLLVASNPTGTYQLYECGAGDFRQLTDYAEPVSGRYVPGGRRCILAMDSGGNERYQLHLFDLDDPPGADLARLEALTDDPRFTHQLIGVSADGRLIAFLSNRRNGIDFDAWTLDLGTRQERCVYSGGGWCQAGSGFSPDGRWLSIIRPGPRPLDCDVLLVEVRTGEVRVVLEHPEEAATVGTPAWAGRDGLFVSSNVGRDVCAIVYCDVDSGASTLAVERPYDLECFSGADGRSLLVVGNEGGACEAELFSVASGASGGFGGELTSQRRMPLPHRGVISFSFLTPPPLVAADGAGVTFTFSSPKVPGDVWRYDVRTGELKRVTVSAGLLGQAGELAGVVEPTTHDVTSFDGERVPVFVYRPAPVLRPTGGGASGVASGGASGGASGEIAGGEIDSDSGDSGDSGLPVVLFIHGGPEGQSVLSFNPIIQGLVEEGYAVVVPNVRGSTGYGKRYAGLDDTTRRLDSVADLAAIHDWLPSQGIDPGRAALMGGSYGGYMVLAGCAFQPERWAAGVDVVGISDLVTFLENTSAYRRAHREHEYGSLATDREFLAGASPLRSVDAIRAPLFVIHGANDPRVPLSEAEQLVASLSARGIECELVVYPDEGHGVQKLANRLDAYPRAVGFLNRVVRAVQS